MMQNEPGPTLLARVSLWLSRRRALNVALVVAYFLLASLPHDIVQSLFLGWYVRYTRERVDLVIIGGLAVCAVVGFFYGVARIRSAQRPLLTIIYCILTLMLFGACYFNLFFTVAEVAHFPQYAVLVLLIYPLTGRITRALWYAIFFAFIDEGYQYLVLYNPRWPSLLDLNDVVFDTAGAGSAAVLLHLENVRRYVARPKPRLITSPVVWIIAAGFAACVIFYSTGTLGIYPDWPRPNEPKRPLMFSRQRMVPYWRDGASQKRYHSLRPWEGFPLIAAIVGLFGLLDHVPTDERKSISSQIGT